MKHLEHLKRNDWATLVEAIHYVQELRESGAEWFKAFETYCLKTKSPQTWREVDEMRPHVHAIGWDLSNDYYENSADLWECPDYDNV